MELALLVAAASLAMAYLAWHTSRLVRSIEKTNAPTRRSSTEKLRQINEALVDQARTLEATLVSLREAQQELVQSEKLAVIGQLAAGVAHEINNPCAFVL